MLFIRWNQNRFCFVFILACNSSFIESCKVRSNNEDSNVEAVFSIKAPNAQSVAVKKLLLKDNDCGNRPGNPKAMTLSDINKLTHMHPRSYKGIRFLAQEWKKGSAKTFFANEMLLNTVDYSGREALDSVGKRIIDLSAALTERCETGKLLLDLDIKEHINGLNSPNQVK